jgi:SpoVK/Ycf46/Vps4 family AAA+-type ATPase
MSTNYAGLLADKLEQDGYREQAMRIRERLARAPSAIAHAQDSSRNTSGLPIDSESKLYTVDLSQAEKGSVMLKLPTASMSRVTEFVNSVIHYDKLQSYAAALPLRLMLYGPPGTGKTQTAKWIASELSLPLLTVRCDTLISSLLGQTSKNLRRVFEYASDRPCVLFLDELDALANSRGNEKDIGELQRVVISLLQNIDALENNVILLAASNHEKLLDRAIWRRFPFQIPLPLPDAVLRHELWTSMLGSEVIKGLDIELLVAKSEGISGALIEQVVMDAKRHAILSGDIAINHTELFRRLAITLALNAGIDLTNTNDEVQWLRKWDSKLFSIRELSRLYKSSTRKITQLIEGIND